MPTLGDIVAHLGGQLVGDATVSITQIGSLDAAEPGEIAFLSNAKYLNALKATRASAVILPPQAEQASALPRILTDNPYLYYARLGQWLNPPRHRPPGVHASAVVESALPASVSVGPLAYVGPDCEIGENVVIGPGCVVERGVRLGAGTVLTSRVSIYHECRLGERCIVHAGAVIGADGFGYARERSGAWIKIPQIGCVVIGDDVEIGANTTVDRGALDDTVIAEGVKLDNQVQIAHNVHIGAHSAMAGCVGVAGSARIGERVMVGGQAGISGHLTIADDTVVSARTLVSKSVTKAGVLTSAMPAMPHDEWMKSAAHFRRLDTLASRLRELEKRIAEMEKAV
ncbi:UDP-3-O-(3-hydroxymyristoyl)glucosamine N-acyltransferase [Niveibacterium sp. SC-1]|uniref:UDP-3-O-(3-hydroxymyristoyl)glucosamine N-acyltransferase n=1 Tax=Niveibacterium sp. SC-1 TaxID=3135646 RepID=UPI00311F58BB